jgi:hypothetical protein
MSLESRLEHRKSLLARAILSLPAGASSSLMNLDPEILFSRQPRPCDWCGKMLTDINGTSIRGGLRRFCNQSCSTRWWMQFPEFKAKSNTPESHGKSGEGRRRFLASGTPEALAQIDRIRKLKPSKDINVRKKMSRRLEEIGHRPPIRGGNGKGPTRTESMLMGFLPGWLPMTVTTGMGRKGLGYPGHYKLDLADPNRKIAIELDGMSHRLLSRREQDRRKDEFLRSKGWIVLRFWNQEIIDWIDSGMSEENSVSMTFRQHGIVPSQSGES